MNIDELIEAGASPERAEALVEAAGRSADPLLRWREVSQTLRPDEPMELHHAAHRACFAAWKEDVLGPAPMTVPDDAALNESNLARAMREGGGTVDVSAFHRHSVRDPEHHWADMLQRLGIVFATPPSAMVEGTPTEARWLPGAVLNIAESALSGDDDRVAVVVGRPDDAPGRGDAPALARVTLGELRRDAMRVAHALEARGLSPGDAIAIDMPMTYASVAIYLGIVAFGGAVVSIADSFAAAEIATRLRISEAKAVFTQDVILRAGKTLPLYDRVTAAQAPTTVVLPAEGDTLAVELRDGDVSWSAFLDGSADTDRYHRVDADTATNILFSSGTTGDPKAIPWTHVTPIKAASDAWGHQDVRPGDVVAWPTNLGWMMGPWLIYASLLNGATIALYEGLPHSRGFGAFVDAARVTMLGVVPSLVKAWRQTGALDGRSLATLRCFSSTGEASNPADMMWLSSRARYRPILEYCGGTELGGGYICGTVVQPQVASAFSTACFGCELVLLDEEGNVTRGSLGEGELALVPPMLGSSSRLLNRDHQQVYFAGMPTTADGRPLRRHGDQMRRLPGGYFRAMGRVDDTMNLGGIKVSSAEIERTVNRLPEVVETAAIAVSPTDGGPSQLVIYAVLEGSVDPSGLQPVMKQTIARELNPLFKLHALVPIDALPRTASGKVMRRRLRQRFEEEK